MGDSFRWKAENTSTAQVEGIMSNLIGLKDVVVFAVTVPGADGTAGMAVVADPEGHVDVPQLSKD